MIFMHICVVYVYTRMNTNASEIVSTLSAPEHTVIIVDFILICTSVIGAVGNILIIFVICRNRSLRTAMNANLVSLAVADLIVCFFLLPVRLVLYNNEFFGVTNFAALCQIDVFIKTACDSAQLFMLVSTSFERYQSIARPFEKQGHGKRTAISLTVSWILSVGLGTFNSQYCGDGATFYPCYSQGKTIFPGQWGDKERSITLPLGLLCLLLVMLFYGKIMKLLNEHNATMQNRFKKFKNKVNPEKKIAEKSTSILKFHSTVPIQVKQIDGEVQNGLDVEHKSPKNVDSGFNENECNLKDLDSKSPGKNARDGEVNNKSGHDSTNLQMNETKHNLTKTDKSTNSQTLTLNNNAKNNGLNTAMKKGNYITGNPWKKIISDRIFGNSSSKTTKTVSFEPITVLKVRETKRFPLARQRVTLANLESSKANNLNKLNLRRLNSVPLRERFRRVKSASALLHNMQENQTQNVETKSSASCSTLQERRNGRRLIGIRSASYNREKIQATITKTIENIRNSNFVSSNQNDQSSDNKQSNNQNMKSLVSEWRPMKVVDNSPIENINEALECSTDNNKFPTPETENHNNGLESLEDIKLCSVKESEPITNQSDMCVTENILTNNSQDHNKTGTSYNNELIPLKMANGNLDHAESHQPSTSVNVTEKVADEDVVSCIKFKPTPLKRVEVVEMDGTVHKKVKVESGSVVGAVCVMNNSNKVQGRRKVEMRTAKNIAILIGTFILLWLPLPVAVIYFSSSYQTRHVSVEPVLYIASASTLTIAMNPLLNVLLNKQMRSRTINTLRNCKKIIR